MKLAKFYDICKKKWDNGRGDVIEVHLTEESYGEFYKDLLIDRSDGLTAIIVHPSWNILNPVTRSEVKFRVAKEHEFILTYYAGHCSESKDDVDGLQRAG